MKKISIIVISLLCAALMVCAAGGETRQGEEFIGEWEFTSVTINGIELDAETFQQLGGVDMNVSFTIDEQGVATMQMSSAAIPEYNMKNSGTWTVDGQGVLYLDGTALPFITIDASTGNMVWDMADFGLDGVIVLENKQPEPGAKATIKDVSFTGSAVVGKVSKPAQGLTVGVTFYIEGNYYMGTVGQVEEDGSFEVEGVGPIRYITVILKSPEGEKLSAKEIYVQ